MLIFFLIKRSSGKLYTFALHFHPVFIDSEWWHAASVGLGCVGWVGILYKTTKGFCQWGEKL